MANPVAFLRFMIVDSADSTSRLRPIFAGDEFDVGRRDIYNLFGYESKTISSHHFRIHCIVFDEEDTSVGPMVYLDVLSSQGVVISDHGSTVHHITRAHGPRLLNTGDTIELSSKVHVKFAARETAIHRSKISRVLRCSTGSFRLTDHVIGSGAYAQVMIAFDDDDRQLACKVIPIGTDPHQQHWHLSTLREVQLLKNMDHANIISVRKILETTEHTYILQQLATGGDLLSYQHSRGTLAESEVLCMAYQLTHAVHYLHSRGIVHRDIKPENILLTSWRPGTRIVLTDFGQARYLPTKPQDASSLCMNSIAGTEGWQAPFVPFREAS